MGILKERLNGKTSLIRVLVLFAAILSGIVVICGIIGWFLNKPDAATIIATGTGLYTLSEFAKALQKKAEREKE
jgi:ABC-type Mn2+/Zn2+ transport system permease subunit